MLSINFYDCPNIFCKILIRFNKNICKFIDYEYFALAYVNANSR